MQQQQQQKIEEEKKRNLTFLCFEKILQIYPRTAASWRLTFTSHCWWRYLNRIFPLSVTITKIESLTENSSLINHNFIYS